MTKYSLRARMMILILAPTLIIGLLLSTFFVIHRSNQLQDQLASAGASIIEPLAAVAAYSMVANQQEMIQPLINMLHRRHSDIVRAIIITNAQHQVLFSTDSRHITQLIDAVKQQPMPSGLHSHQVDDKLLLHIPITIGPEFTRHAGKVERPGATVGYVLLELDTDSIMLQQYQETFIATLLMLLCMGIAGLFAYRLVRDVTMPIRNMVDTVDRIRRGQLDSRAEGCMLGELDMLKNGINAMAMSLTAYHEEMQQNIDQATYDLRETLEQMEIQNVELDLAKKRAQEAARIKSEFLANMSHELRTPLNGVIGFTRQTLKTTLTATQTDYLRTIERSANNLLAIINDVLDFSKLEAGKLVLENIPFSLHNTLDDVITLLAHTAHEKGLELTLNIQPGVPERFVGDPMRLQQVITNLLGNAIKFTEKGNIDIRVERHRQSHKRLELEIQIRDTGIGIAEGQQAQLFQAFRQADTSISRRHGGTGLGLVITQRLVKEMGGDIRFQSTVNQGSTFWFHITLTCDPHSAVAENNLSVLQGHSIAYVEANASAAQAGLDILGQTPLQVHFSPTLEQLPPQHFDILLLGVPVRHRNTLLDYTSQLRDMSRKAACVILALPSLAQMDAEQLKSFGIHACLSKPLSSVRLLPLIQEGLLIQQLSLLPVTHAATLPTPRLPLCVMAVDDNPANLKLIGTLLEEQVENTLLCDSGEEAIAQAAMQDIDVILMDIQMPGMDGIRASEHIRQLSRHATTPIIAVSAHSLSDERKSLLQAGMDGYLAKPIDEQMLASVLARYTQQPVIPVESENGSMTQLLAEHDDSQLSLDWSLATRQAANKPDLARDLLQMLLDSLPDVQRHIETLLAGHPVEDTLPLIHKLHGSCGYSGVPRLKQLCYTLETALRKGTDLLELEPEWLELLDEIANVRRAAQAHLQ
ncbi:two-component sensor histidine kinase BarA [Candidatus Symbiopectobacterium sp. NZEC151]|uniref:two-component sensor histidine kinase BarA n=2 Tax=unclassified Symbiopectobacterium TaxID=2794573 RepID=UPI002227D6EC|nr:two-component sensor histidine kinase BarA [Candidatus Symbiopectobacterium sp. NZEC151]MCW2476273.1 two-component sensor histidine kinase BarA [Candidatus Symbiopectobacterium sp. NZEC151]